MSVKRLSGPTELEVAEVHWSIFVAVVLRCFSAKQDYCYKFGEGFRQSVCDQLSPLDFGAVKSPLTTALRDRPPHCGEPVGARFSLSRPDCLQTSALGGFSAVLVNN